MIEVVSSVLKESSMLIKKNLNQQENLSQSQVAIFLCQK